MVISPQEVENLETAESKLLLQAYRSSGYWFSEMYEYRDNMRTLMRKVLRQLLENGKGPDIELQLKQYDLECKNGLF
jgi:hypothetical protein